MGPREHVNNVLLRNVHASEALEQLSQSSEITVPLRGRAEFVYGDTLFLHVFRNFRSTPTLLHNVALHFALSPRAASSAKTCRSSLHGGNNACPSAGNQCVTITQQSVVTLRSSFTQPPQLSGLTNINCAALAARLRDTHPL